jgi:asparagine synthase (glutamine-hydrolysing)
MAGLYITIGDVRSDRIAWAASRLAFSPRECVETFIEPEQEIGVGIAWVSHGPPLLFAPAYHPETGVRIFTSGRVAWDEPQWQYAKTLHTYEGGLSNRLLLEQYLKGGISALECPNGAAIVAAWEPRSRCLHIITDCLGYHPLFLYLPHSIPGCVISTFPDAIAEDSAVQTTPDCISMVEFLRDWQATPPHTYYQEIKYAGAARHLCWNLSERNFQTREYWQPFKTEFLHDLSSATEQFATAIRNSVRIRTLPRLAPIAIYISGGLDSRLLAFAAADPNLVLGINLFDVANRETKLARALCEAARIRYLGFARDRDYYPKWMRAGASMSGAMWSLEDNHFLGTLDLLAENNVQTVLSGCIADNLFKGDTLDRQRYRLFGRDLPFWMYKSYRTESQLPYPNYQPRHAPPKFRAQVEERFARWFANTPTQLRSNLDRALVDDKRVRPLCYASALSGQIMFRAFPYDAFLADRSLVDFYSRIPTDWKLNGKIWGKVVAEICGNDILDSNYGWRPGASNTEKFLVFARDWVRRRLGQIPTVGQQGIATDGSWPNLGWYVTNSPTLKQMWSDTPASDRALMTELWGSNPWQISLDDWSKQPYDFFRIATLLTHWTVRRDRPSAPK